MSEAGKTLETGQAGPLSSKTLPSSWVSVNVISLPPPFPVHPRGNRITHTYLKTFSASTFCSGFSFPAPFSGTKRWMFDLARVVSFCFVFLNHCSSQPRTNVKPAHEPLYQLGPSSWNSFRDDSPWLKKVTKYWLLFSISSPYLIVSLTNVRFISL